MLRWAADDSREEYRHLAKIPCWEVPLMEVVLKADIDRWPFKRV